ncbi:MAG: hypothetical protein QG640_573 [Patescibacteria group bacterium]|nr:hypothetical protein [Patescibacteria group bacterium]
MHVKSRHLKRRGINSFMRLMCGGSQGNSHGAPPVTTAYNPKWWQELLGFAILALAGLAIYICF